MSASVAALPWQDESPSPPRFLPAGTWPWGLDGSPTWLVLQGWREKNALRISHQEAHGVCGPPADAAGPVFWKDPSTTQSREGGALFPLH